MSKHARQHVRTSASRPRRRALALLAATALASSALIAAGTGTALAATTVVNETSLGVTWSTADTRPGGSTAFVTAADAPYGSGALQLDTDATVQAKAQLMSAVPAGTPVADITKLGYWNKTVAGQAGVAAASYQLVVDLDGIPDNGIGFTTLVYEPYQSSGRTPAVGTWEYWDVDQGLFWSTRSFGTDIVGAAGGPATYTLDYIKAKAPNAVVLGIGANIGTYNPGWTVLVDGLEFNDATYDFDPRVFSKDDCKSGGWATNFASGKFINQGDCVSYFASGGRTHPAG